MVGDTRQVGDDDDGGFALGFGVLCEGGGCLTEVVELECCILVKARSLASLSCNDDGDDDGTASPFTQLGLWLDRPGAINIGAGLRL